MVMGLNEPDPFPFWASSLSGDFFSFSGNADAPSLIYASSFGRFVVSFRLHDREHCAVRLWGEWDFPLQLFAPLETR